MALPHYVMAELADDFRAGCRWFLELADVKAVLLLLAADTERDQPVVEIIAPGEHGDFAFLGHRRGFEKRARRNGDGAEFVERRTRIIRADGEFYATDHDLVPD